MKDRLTKTAFLNYLSCPNEYWLDYHDPAPDAELTLEEEHQRQQGYEAENLAKTMQRFRSDETQLAESQRIFQTSELYARSDLVVTDRETGEIDIYEIKALPSVRHEHINDVAFQKMVSTLAGFTVRKCHIITINADYVRRGEIDVEELFLIHDVTAEVESILPAIKEQTRDAIAFLDTSPLPSLADHCQEKKLDCRFIRLHFPELPDYTVFDIARLNNDKRRTLLSLGIVDIRDVPDDLKLSAKQRQQVTAARSGETAIDVDQIRERFNSWAYPHHFLDYETFAYAIPQYDGVKPFQQMCFQYSLHTISEPGAETEHTHFLARFEKDPPREMARSLSEALGDELGTVFVWHESFEKGRNDEMGEAYPEHREFFADLNAHIYDLMKIFSDGLYVHPEFKGRTSIKKVLPVLVPELSYNDLGIGDGMTACISWYHAAKWNTLTDDEKVTIFDDLEAYCHMDTLAMVRIYEVLRDI